MSKKYLPGFLFSLVDLREAFDDLGVAGGGVSVDGFVFSRLFLFSVFFSSVTGLSGDSGDDTPSESRTTIQMNNH